MSDIGPVGPVRACCELPGDGLLPPPLLVFAEGLLAPPLPAFADVLAAGEDEPSAELLDPGVYVLVDATLDVAWCVIGRGSAA